MAQQIWTGFGWVLGYYLAFIAAGLVLRRFVPMPSELFRKLLHLIALCSVFILVYGPADWIAAAIICGLFVFMIFPVLSLVGRIPGFTDFMTERRSGEMKRSMIWMYLVLAFLICVCWGWLGKKYLVVASALSWGVGDAAAALIGKRFGKRHIVGKFVEGRKSLEGTLAMFTTSFLAVFGTLFVNRAPMRGGIFLGSAVTAAITALVELFTLRGLDTLTCPLAAAMALLLLAR